ncbi:nitroreductase [Fructilactobacillus lindneri]|uniref:Nitroreductase n=1 Tax=Fructilactobacillus lindneri TaxID=53444 RepID=A0AB33BQD0_9LACO|nr:nitroreductase family protein [Fructilactobacillus lindneri]ANZ57364.1 nitroreductase [Fructilactobacillus lindneri]ANZ58629.1 nitroreductase [Fructilactobacillus lindneri]POG97667.1 nitroreductase [Fructilactobacillus lindneri]POG99004.1 nitroreductase [Fructilactobacillus lindneri]POG99325.1 nitroreductase [Fructilactobacillus lindneri]
MNFYNLQKKRRSIYALGKNITKTDEEIYDVIKKSVRESPTSFNSQSVRAVVLFGDSNKKLWNITLDKLHEVSKSEDAFEKTANKVNNSFKSGIGTVLLYTDEKVVKNLENKFPSYAANFYDWSEQAIGIADYSIWVALAEMGIGASNQHYNPLIDEEVAKEFNIPDDWILRAEIPFGSIEAPAGEKDYMEDNKRFKIFK